MRASEICRVTNCVHAMQTGRHSILN